MKSRRWLLVGLAAVAVVVVVAAFLWLTRWQTAVIPDVTQPADLTLTARPGDGLLLGDFWGIGFRVIGEIDGEAEVWFGDNGTRQRVSGRVDCLFGGDWFQPTCDFHYRPKGVTTGKLVVRYQFR